MSSNEVPAATRDQEVMETEEVEVGEGSNGDPAATRDQEVKETEEVDVGEGPAEGGEHVAVGGAQVYRFWCFSSQSYSTIFR